MRRQIERPGRKLGRPRKRAPQRRKAKEKKLRLLADQFRLRAQDTNRGNWDEEDGWSCGENSIKLYTDIGTQPLTATFFSSILSQFSWVMYPATSTLLLSFCTYVIMSINPNQKKRQLPFQSSNL